MTQTPDEREKIERDGFIKTAIIAYAANFWAHNTPISPEQIVAKAAQMAELTWEAIVEMRKKNEPENSTNS